MRDSLPECETPTYRQSMTSSRQLSTGDLTHQETPTGYSWNTWREQSQPAMTNVITEPLPDPIKVLNAASIQTFLANAELYDLRTGLRLNPS